MKIIEHLRVHLPDEILGLVETADPEPGAMPQPDGEAKPPAGPNGPPDKPGDAAAKPKPASYGARNRPGRMITPRQRPEPLKAPRLQVVPTAANLRIRRASDPVPQPEGASRPPNPRLPMELPTPPFPPHFLAQPPSGPPSLKLPMEAGGGIKITIEIQPPNSGQTGLPTNLPLPNPPVDQPADAGLPDFSTRPVAPADSTRVFVDVTAYNSKFYFVQGDVAKPGKMPWTGSDTVLDALNYAGGFLPHADSSDFRLIRPDAAAGKPARTYKIDWDAIAIRGDKTKNYQIFPGDRLWVGRSKLVQSTMYLDRLAASLHTLVNTSLQATFMMRSLVAATPDLTPAQRETILKEWFEIYWKAAHQPGGPEPD